MNKNELDKRSYLLGVTDGKDSSKKWISINERYPEFGKEVLIFEDGYINIGEYCDYSDIGEKNGFITDDGRTVNPTHWMPVPEYPCKK